jgi:hypothetical protein
MTFGIKSLRANCSCGEEVTAEMQLPNGFRGIFIVHDAFEGVDVVVHFAAESHVDRSILGSKAFFETNVEGICLNAVQQHELEERTITNWTIASRITTDHFFVRSLYHMLDLNLRYAIDI